MREITRPEPVDRHKYYGVDVGEQRGMVTCAGYEGPFIILCTNVFVLGNGWNFAHTNNFERFIDTTLSSGTGRRMYQFDTFKELAEWIVGAYIHAKEPEIEQEVL